MWKSPCEAHSLTILLASSLPIVLYAYGNASSQTCVPVLMTMSVSSGCPQARCPIRQRQGPTTIGPSSESIISSSCAIGTGRPVPIAQLLEMIDSLEGPIVVGPCRCRMGHRACGHPLETDIVIRTGTQVWLDAFPYAYR